MASRGHEFKGSSCSPILEPSPTESPDSKREYTPSTVSPGTSIGPSLSISPPLPTADDRNEHLQVSEEPEESENAVQSADGEPECLFQASCDLNAPLRKAVSHIFGRNKSCTRQVPKHLWVWLCRKHYQRSRYRNASDYAILQCTLVMQMIDRLLAWSDENREKNTPQGVIKDWMFGVRRREMDRIKAQNRKRALEDSEEEAEDHNDDEIDSAELNGTAVPQWLLQRVGDGYAVDQIREIIQQVKRELEDGKLKVVPDIEILPNFIETVKSGKKASSKRRQISKDPHKRSLSASVGPTQGSPTMARQLSYPGFPNQDTRTPDVRIANYQQSRGLGEANGSNYGMLQSTQQATLSNRSMQLPHRPAHHSTQAQRPGQGQYHGFYGFDDSRGPFPVPTSRRRASIAMSQPHATLPAPRPPSHQRSHSEYGSIPSISSAGYRSGYLPANTTPSFSGYSHQQYTAYAPAASIDRAAPRATVMRHDVRPGSTTFSQMPFESYTATRNQTAVGHTAATPRYDGLPVVRPIHNTPGPFQARATMPEANMQPAALGDWADSRTTTQDFGTTSYMPPAGSRGYSLDNRAIMPGWTGSHASTLQLPELRGNQDTPSSTSNPPAPRTVKETDRAKQIFSSRR